MTKSKNIISITDIIENKVRKQKELDDYNTDFTEQAENLDNLINNLIKDQEEKKAELGKMEEPDE